MGTKTIIAWVLGILGTLVAAAAIAAVTWSLQLNVETKMIRAELNEMKADRREDIQQDANIRSLWRYGKFLHEQVDYIRFKLGDPPAVKPNLE